MDNLISIITRKYDLLLDTHRASRRFDETREALKQHTYEFREKNRAEVEYERSLRRRLDKLTGKGDRLVQLQKETREARARFEKTTLDWKLQSGIGLELQRQCDALPSPEELKTAAMGNPDAQLLLARREVMLCGEMLLPLVQSNLEALEEYRQQLRGNRMSEVTSAQAHHEVGTAHIGWASQCAGLLRRMAPSLAVLGIPFEIPAYFVSPAAFIESAAAKHNRLDRANAALAQVESLQKLAAQWQSLSS